MKLRAFRLIAVLSLAALGPRLVTAPAAPPAVYSAITAGERISEAGRTMDVCAPSMVVGATCSAADLCWAAAQAALDVTADDGTTLRSEKARDLASYYARGKALVYKKTDHLWSEPLRAIGPSCFFYAYVDTEQRKLVAVQPPARVGAFRIPLTHSKAAAQRVASGEMQQDELFQ